MKKVILASAIALSFVGMVNTASASATSEVRFIGAVSTVTCDLQAEVDGSVNSMVQLGTAKIDTAATPVEFSLKPKAGQNCDLTGKTADISWGGAFSPNGLKSQSGAADDAWVKLTAINSKVPNSLINSTALTTSWDGPTVINDGAKFRAELNGGKKAGDYHSAAAFAVAYK